LDSQSTVEDVPPSDVWRRLEANPKAQLIDVRTRSEWTFVGVPDVTALGRQPVLIEWQSFPGGHADPDFQEHLAALLDKAGIGKDSELFFICRSGGRSRLAAEAMAEAGYGRCFNVEDGFEGPLDSGRHRGGVSGWKSAGLPWVQG
jgi:rhodanese-related sulfurtransferase